MVTGVSGATSYSTGNPVVNILNQNINTTLDMGLSVAFASVRYDNGALPRKGVHIRKTVHSQSAVLSLQRPQASLHRPLSLATVFSLCPSIHSCLPAFSRRASALAEAQLLRPSSPPRAQPHSGRSRPITGTPSCTGARLFCPPPPLHIPSWQLPPLSCDGIRFHVLIGVRFEVPLGFHCQLQRQQRQQQRQQWRQQQRQQRRQQRRQWQQRQQRRQQRQPPHI